MTAAQRISDERIAEQVDEYVLSDGTVIDGDRQGWRATRRAADAGPNYGEAAPLDDEIGGMT